MGWSLHMEMMLSQMMSLRSCDPPPPPRSRDSLHASMCFIGSCEMLLDHMISWRGHVTSLSEGRRGEGWGGVKGWRRDTWGSRCVTQSLLLIT